MGWKSTVHITREDALKELQRALVSISNDDLAEALEFALGYDKCGYNFRIVEEYNKDDYNYREGTL